MIAIILRYTFRSFSRNLFYHLLNISGLVIVFISVFCILIWINLETSYDNFHPAGDRFPDSQPAYCYLPVMEGSFKQSVNQLALWMISGLV